jgi:hypothetical protein
MRVRFLDSIRREAAVHRPPIWPRELATAVRPVRISEVVPGSGTLTVSSSETSTRAISVTYEAARPGFGRFFDCWWVQVSMVLRQFG